MFWHEPSVVVLDASSAMIIAPFGVSLSSSYDFRVASSPLVVSTKPVVSSAAPFPKSSE